MPLFKNTDAYVSNASGTTTGGSGSASIIIMSALDGNAAYSTSTGRYTAPANGFYRVTAFLNGSNSVSIAIYVDAVLSKTIFNTASGPGLGTGSGVVNVTAGQVIDLRTSATIGSWGAGSTMTFERI
jgi:hypothetical protein